MARKPVSSPSGKRRPGKTFGHKSRPRRRNNFVRRVELGVERLEPRWVLASPGSLDTTFDPLDHDGVLVTNLGLPASADLRFNAVTTQADGKIIAVGIVDPLSNNSYDFLVARFNTDGSRDTTFGVDGPDADLLPDGFITFDFNLSASASTAQDVAIDSLGRIIVVGDGPNASDLDSWTVARLTPNGLLDTSFGGGTGKVTTSWSAGALNFSGQAHGVAVQSDNKIVVAGDVRTPNFVTDIDFGIVRYNTDGTLDNTFGTGGKVQIDFFGARDIATELAIQPDGKIVAAGYTNTVSLQSENFAMVRLNTNGTLDSTFGSGGKVHTDIVPGDVSQDEANSIVIQSDGKIVLGGFTFDGSDFVMARYLANGTLDTTFNPTPNPIRPSAPGTLRINFGQSDLAWAIAVQPDGQYVLAGAMSSISAHNNNDSFALARINTNGSLDSSFGSGGLVTTPITNFIPGTIFYAFGTDMTIGPDGKIIEVGYALAPDGHEKAIIARYETGVVVQSIAGPADINEGQTYTLTLASGDPTTSQWSINWGDSVQTVPGNPTSVTHVYADGNANYTISATITTSTGTSPVGNTVAVSVHNVAPTLTIAGAASVAEGALYTLNLSSFDPGADTISQWTINWGDSVEIVSGNPSSATHTYADGPNSYTISATATDEDGTFAAGNTVPVTVNNVAPTLTISGAAAADEGALYTLNLSSFDPGADTITSWTINWGDGSQVVSGNPSSVTHTYDDGPNSYTISATATDEDGTFAAGNTVSVTVNNVAPTLTLAGAAAVAEGSLYTLNLSSFDPGADTITSWTINWGDSVENVSGNPASVTHTYADGPNSYTISATAMDEDGTFAAGNTVVVTVNNVAPTLTLAGAAAVAEGSLYTLNLSSFDPGADTITSWTINWGDSVENVSGNPASITHTYADGSNSYTISATATDEDGTFAAGNTVAVTVNNVAPTLTISGAATVNEGALYTLNLSSFDPGTDTIASWTINWGDGTEVVSGNPSSVTHTYADGLNSYTISATATDEDGTFAAGNTVAVTVNNVAPALSISGASSVNEGSTYALNLSSFDPGADTITQWTINWGNGTQVVTGNPTSVTHVYPNGPANYTISATATDEDGTYAAGNTVSVTVNNVAPTVYAATFSVPEHSSNGTVVGTVTTYDPGTDTLAFSIVGGTGASAFAINSATGQITVTNGSLLDFDTTPTLTLNVQVSDGDGGVGSATVTINLTKLASISGVVYVDVNHNGLFDANEPGIDGITIKLLDQNGNPVLDSAGHAITAVTGNDGLYVFSGLQPGIYQVSEVQPTGVTDGAEHLGSLGGTIVANDRMQLTLASIDAYDYAFAEFGQQLRSGDAAGIGFWQNKNGQALIAQGGTQLAVWLTSHFGNIFGNTLVGMTGSQVATFYRDQIFKGLKLGGPAKVDAQFMAVALATYFTDKTLAGMVAQSYGFNVTDTGIGTRIVNVGTKGAAFNVANGSDRTIMQLLLATNSLTDQPNLVLGFDAIYDIDGNGTISSAEASLRTMANDVFSAINESGGI